MARPLCLLLGNVRTSIGSPLLTRARNVRVFGSVVRGESTDSSDLDLLVDMAEGRSLLDLVALGDDLEEALGVVVDVVTEKSLSPYLRDRIVAEAVSL